MRYSTRLSLRSATNSEPLCGIQDDIRPVSTQETTERAILLNWKPLGRMNSQKPKAILNARRLALMVVPVRGSGTRVFTCQYAHAGHSDGTGDDSYFDAD